MTRPGRTAGPEKWRGSLTSMQDRDTVLRNRGVGRIGLVDLNHRPLAPHARDMATDDGHGVK